MITQAAEKFLHELKDKYGVDPYPMIQAKDDAAAALMLIDMLFAHIRTQADQIEQLQNTTAHLSSPDDEN